MCQRCNYTELMKDKGIDPTPNRMRIMEVVGNNPGPIAAQDILMTLRRSEEINRVTVYRILDLLVEKGLVERLSSGGRSLVYALTPNENHPAHPHFHCNNCGAFECLQPGSVGMDIAPMQRSFAGQINSIEIRINGICRNCLRTDKNLKKEQKKG